MSWIVLGNSSQVQDKGNRYLHLRHMVPTIWENKLILKVGPESKGRFCVFQSVHNSLPCHWVGGVHPQPTLDLGTHILLPFLDPYSLQPGTEDHLSKKKKSSSLEQKANKNIPLSQRTRVQDLRETLVSYGSTFCTCQDSGTWVQGNQTYSQKTISTIAVIYPTRIWAQYLSHILMLLQMPWCIFSIVSWHQSSSNSIIYHLLLAVVLSRTKLLISKPLWNPSPLLCDHRKSHANLYISDVCMLVHRLDAISVKLANIYMRGMSVVALCACSAQV